MKDTKYVGFFTGMYRQKHHELRHGGKWIQMAGAIEKVFSFYRWEWDGARFVEEQRKWPKWYHPGWTSVCTCCIQLEAIAIVCADKVRCWVLVLPSRWAPSSPELEHSLSTGLCRHKWVLLKDMGEASNLLVLRCWQGWVDFSHSEAWSSFCSQQLRWLR